MTDAGIGRGGPAAGVYNTGALNAQGSTFSGNYTQTLYSNDGGAVYNAFNGQVTMSYSTITGNQARSGPAILALNPTVNDSSTKTGPIVLDHVTVSNNRDRGFGAIYVAADMTPTNCAVSGNTAIDGSYDGGGIDAYNGDFVLSDSTVSGNTSSYLNAAGVEVGGRNVTITRSVISDNVNAGLGVNPNENRIGDTGGLSAAGQSLTLSDSQITGNTGITGGAQPNATGITRISNTTISGNTGITPRTRKTCWVLAVWSTTRITTSLNHS